MTVMLPPAKIKKLLSAHSTGAVAWFGTTFLGYQWRYGIKGVQC